MTIFIGGDHAGYTLKEKLLEYLKSLGYEVIDKGPFEYNPDDDYPDFCREVAKAVSENLKNSMGIILGGTGQGEAIGCNRFAHIRTSVFYGGNTDVVKVSREHNDANILSLGARFVTEDEAKQAVKIFLETKFSGDERHIRRINKIDDK